MGTYEVETTTFVKIRANHGKKINLLNSPNKITNVDDMMIHNLINILSKLYLICEI
jgi:hypothetical protein